MQPIMSLHHMPVSNSGQKLPVISFFEVKAIYWRRFPTLIVLDITIAFERPQLEMEVCWQLSIPFSSFDSLLVAFDPFVPLESVSSIQ